MSANRITIKGLVGFVKTLHAGTEKEVTTVSINCSDFAGYDNQGNAKYDKDWFYGVGFVKGGKSKYIQSMNLQSGDKIEIEGPLRSNPRKDPKTGITHDNWQIYTQEILIISRKKKAA